MFTIEQATLRVNILKVAAVMIPIAVLAYEILGGRVKVRELKAKKNQL